LSLQFREKTFSKHFYVFPCAVHEVIGSLLERNQNGSASHHVAH
jgi:hypothetical protein